MSKNVCVKVEGTLISIVFDTSVHSEVKSKSGKSFVVCDSAGLIKVTANGKTYNASARLWELLPKADVYEAEVARVKAINVEGGMTPEKAEVAARKSVKPPREPKPTEATVTKALEKARTTGVTPAETPVTPPPARPGKSRVEVQIAPRKSR